MPSYKSFWSSLSYHAITRPAITAVKNFAGSLSDRYRRRRLIRKGIDPDRRMKILQRTRGKNTWNNGRMWSKSTMAGQKRRSEAAARMITLRGAGKSRSGGLGPAPFPSQKKEAAKQAARKAKRDNFRTNLRKQIRGPQVARARLWDKSKGYESVSKRRKEAATKFRNSPAWRNRPQRRRTGVLPQKGGSTAPSTRKPTAAQQKLVRGTPVGSIDAAVYSSHNYGQLRRKLGRQAVGSVIRRFGSQNAVTSRKHKADTIRALRKDKFMRQHMRDMVKADKGKRMTTAARLLAAKNKK